MRGFFWRRTSSSHATHSCARQQSGISAPTQRRATRRTTASRPHPCSILNAEVPEKPRRSPRLDAEGAPADWFTISHCITTEATHDRPPGGLTENIRNHEREWDRRRMGILSAVARERNTVRNAACSPRISRTCERNSTRPTPLILTGDLLSHVSVWLCTAHPTIDYSHGLSLLHRAKRVRVHSSPQLAMTVTLHSLTGPASPQRPLQTRRPSCATDAHERKELHDKLQDLM